MAIIKKSDIEVLAQMNGEELERFLKRLPGTREQFERLFDHLEEKVRGGGCDHTSRFTMQFLMQNMMDFGKVSGWLSQNGGYCDCKVLEEIASEWRRVFDSGG